MKIVKRDVDELNELAKKITGVNPKSKTTAQALNYIEQNYSGGSSDSSSLIMLEENETDGTINLTPEQYDSTKMYVMCKKYTEGDNVYNEGDIAYVYLFCTNAYIPIDDSGSGEYSITFKNIINNSMDTYTTNLKNNKFKKEEGMPS